MKRSLICNYDVRYRWMHEVFVNRDSSIQSTSGKSANTSDSDNVENMQIPNQNTAQKSADTAQHVEREHEPEPEHDAQSEHKSSDHEHAHAEHTRSEGQANTQEKPRKYARRRKGPTSVKRKIGQEVASQIEMSPEALQKLPTMMEEVPFDTEEESLGIPQVDDPHAYKQFKKFQIRHKNRQLDRRSMLRISPESEKEISRRIIASKTPPVNVASNSSVGEQRVSGQQQVPNSAAAAAAAAAAPQSAPQSAATPMTPHSNLHLDTSMTEDENSRITNPFMLHSPLFRPYTVADPSVDTIQSIFPPPGSTQNSGEKSSKLVTSADVLGPLGLSGVHGPAISSLSYRGGVDPDFGNGVAESLDLGTEDAINSLLLDPYIEGDASAGAGNPDGEVDPGTVFARALKRTPSTQVLPPLVESFTGDSLGLNFDSAAQHGFAPLSSSSDSHGALQNDDHNFGGTTGSGNMVSYQPDDGFLANLTDVDHFMYFVDQVADDLVPIPFEESPYFKHLPAQAQNDKLTWDLLVAFGATHRAVRLSTDRMGKMHPADAAKVDEYIQKCEQQLEYILTSNPQSHHALLGATLLAMIEQDRGSAKRWWYYLDVALHVIRLRPSFADWELDNEVNSMLFRLVGFMTSMANLLCGPAPRILAFPSWPQWSGSLDHLTGVDLNLLPLFSEVAFLVKSTESHISRALNIYEQQRIFENKLESPAEQRLRVKHWTFDAIISSSAMQKIRLRALRIFQRINDYWIEEFIPDSDITAMCILFQESLQIHLLRKVLLFPASHPVVQRIIILAMRHLETYIPPQSHIQRNMAFILATLASEAIDLRHRTVLLIRLRNMAEAGFKHHWRLCRDLKQHWGMNQSLICSRAYTLLTR